jgi:hypothetical protein
MIEALPTPASEMLAEIAASDRPLSSEELASRLNRVPRGGSWNTAMAMLRANGLIVETREGRMVKRIGKVELRD